MVYEYALEPELVASWGDLGNYRYFIEKFGLGQPRLVSAFPKLKNWRRRVLLAATGCKDFELERIIALISVMTERMVSRDDAEFDGNVSWLENVTDEHQRLPFHGIIAQNNSDNDPAFLCPESLHSSSRWTVDRGITIPRQAQNMAEAVATMLANCREAIFIDPHFGAENPRFVRPLKAFLGQLLPERRQKKIARVEVHTSAKASVDFFRNSCNEHLMGVIPPGLCVVFKRWRQRLGGEKLHNRYILTDLGGVGFQAGLDDGKPGETDDVTLLDRDQYLLRWSQYASELPAFDLAEEPFEVIGKG